MTELTTLPEPEVVQILSAEDLLSQAKAKFIELAPDLADRVALESEPVTKLLEVIVYCVLVSLARINDVAKANLLAFASGADLDHLGAFYDLPRIPGEDDSRFRTRIQLRIMSLAGGGTSEYYREKAMTADLGVVDVAVLTPGTGSVDLALWLSPGTDAGTAIAHVSAALNGETAKIIGVPVSVRVAVQKSIEITARIYREPTAPLNLAETAEQRLRSALNDHAMLGRNVARSWIDAILHFSGVARVELTSPPADIFIAPDEYVSAGSIVIHDGGVEW